MDTVEFMQFSLGLAFEHLDHLVSDLTQEQADWLPAGKASPIGDLNQGQILELFIIGHIHNHSGEISALKGCQGLKGYPW